MVQVTILEYQKQKKLEYLIYRAALLLEDVGFLQEFTDTKLFNGFSKFTLNFRFGIFISMIYHRISTSLRYFFDFANFIYQRSGAFCCQCTNIFALKAEKLNAFNRFGMWEV